MVACIGNKIGRLRALVVPLRQAASGEMGARTGGESGRGKRGTLTAALISAEPLLHHAAYA